MIQWDTLIDISCFALSSSTNNYFVVRHSRRLRYIPSTSISALQPLNTTSAKMATQRWNVPMALVAVCTCFLSLLSQASAQILCSDINTSSMSSPSKHHRTLSTQCILTVWFLDVTQFQSYGSCTQYCTAFYSTIQPKIYAWAILQDHKCWCSDYSPTGDNSTTGCTEPCPGYGPNICGSADGNFFSYIESGRLSPVGTAGAGGPSGAASTTANPVSTVCYPHPLAFVLLLVVVMLALMATILTFNDR
jgi:hypothetical protein